ncbi:MAG: CRISPR-associated protein Cas4 [Coriobacteriia bacterium]
MFSEDELVLISAIEHYAYCPRQFALIHVEQTFRENALTIAGSHEHARADEPHVAYHAGVRVEYAVPLWSDELGLAGRADAIEFLDDGTIWPVEYKHGARHLRSHDDLQLCAQALCLEEMLGIDVDAGSVFYRKTRRWRVVGFDAPLRRATLDVIDAVREVQKANATPAPVSDQRCDQCSLVEVCSPEALEAALSWNIDAVTTGGA